MNRAPISDFESYRDEQRASLLSFLDTRAPEREKWIRKNSYYYGLLDDLVAFHVPPGQRVCHFGCDSGRLLDALDPAEGTGIALSDGFAAACGKRFPRFSFLSGGWEEKLAGKTFDYVVVTNLGFSFDIQDEFRKLRRLCHHRTKIIVINNNYLWEPLYSLGEKLRMRTPQPTQRQNWIPTHVILDTLRLSSMEMVRWDAHILVPFNIPGITWFCNKLLSSIWPWRFFSMVHVVVARVSAPPPRPIRCSIVVPCRNERGHIEGIVERMPSVGDETELIFVDDRSSDGTGDEVRRFIAAHPERRIVCIEGPGVSKGEAVRCGFRAATGAVLAILDADIAVAPEELPKCLAPILEGHADFVNTVRFVYPQQTKAMRWLNVVGNKVFALIFSVLLQQRIGDTLCGTKAFWKDDYENIDRYRDFWTWRDRWGDFEQLLGASKLGLKIVDVPVHYMERTYGETKMKNRFENGLLMLKVCLAGLFKLRLR